jgi:hypothetical protein
MSLRLLGSGSRRVRWAVGGFLAVSLGVPFVTPGISAAGAATVAHRTHPITSLKPRPHGSVPHIAAGNLINHGGPVQSTPHVYVDFWGSWGTTGDPNGERSYLTNFLEGVCGTSWLSTVAQYGGGWRCNLLVATWNDNVTIPSHPTDSQIQAEAANADTHFAAGTSANVEIVVATPHGHSTSGFGTQWCAYHGAVSSRHNITYTNLPYQSDAGFSCGEGSVNNPGTLDGVSIVEGHEMAESITDPLLNAWYDSSGQEIGDKCAWINLKNISTSHGTFPVQPLWSNSAGGCVG